MPEVVRLEARQASGATRIAAALLRRAWMALQFARWRWRFSGFGWRSTLRSPAILSGTSRVRIGRNVHIWPGARIEAVCDGPGAALTIGDGTTIQLGFHVGAALSVEIGENVMIGGNVYVTDHDHELPRPGRPPGGSLRAARTRIDDDCWLGEGARVLKGVHLGRGCVVGAGAVVTRSFGPYCVVGGVPARLLRPALAPESLADVPSETGESGKTVAAARVGDVPDLAS